MWESKLGGYLLNVPSTLILYHNLLLRQLKTNNSDEMQVFLKNNSFSINNFKNGNYHTMFTYLTVHRDSFEVRNSLLFGSLFGLHLIPNTGMLFVLSRNFLNFLIINIIINYR